MPELDMTSYFSIPSWGVCDENVYALTMYRKARNFHGIKFSWIGEKYNFRGTNVRGLDIDSHTICM